METTSVVGLVATTPRHLVTQDGLPITSFRLACAVRRFDVTQSKWVDGETNWFTIISYRQLANNAVASINKGDRVFVSGKIRVREWDNGTMSSVSVEIEADTLGHDLAHGTSQFVRTVMVRDTEPVPDAASTFADNAAFNNSYEY